MTNNVTPIDNLIEIYRERLAKAEQIRDLINGDMEFAKELLSILQAVVIVDAVPSGRPTVTQKRGHADIVAGFFNSCGNEWTSIMQIAEITGLAETSIRQVIYKTRANDFEKKPLPGHGRIKVWRLKITGEEGG